VLSDPTLITSVIGLEQCLPKHPSYTAFSEVCCRLYLRFARPSQQPCFARPWQPFGGQNMISLPSHHEASYGTVRRAFSAMGTEALKTQVCPARSPALCCRITR
jgi:hypothetical protein